MSECLVLALGFAAGAGAILIAVGLSIRSKLDHLTTVIPRRGAEKRDHNG